MGDFNLSHRIAKDQEKVKDLCQTSKVSALNEITRSISNNQLDYILMDMILRSITFVTSYNNFISDHNSITARIGLNGNQFTNAMNVKMTFDSESHLKEMHIEESESESSISIDVSESSTNKDQDLDSESLADDESFNETFGRRFKNIDKETCWLNSCLQLLLTAIDHIDYPILLESELGTELMQLKMDNQAKPLDPTEVKNIIVASEDTRITLRLSELATEILDPVELNHKSDVVKRQRFDLLSGQQCIRDLFLCLQGNAESWPDVSSLFYFKITHSTTCCGCDQVTESETDQMYVEMRVPPHNTSLNDSVEELFNKSTLVGRFCDGKCQRFVQAEKCSKMTLARESEFFVVILTRAVETLDGFKLIESQTIPTADVLIR